MDKKYNLSYLERPLKTVFKLFRSGEKKSLFQNKELDQIWYTSFPFNSQKRKFCTLFVQALQHLTAGRLCEVIATYIQIHNNNNNSFYVNAIINLDSKKCLAGKNGCAYINKYLGHISQSPN